MKMPELGVQNPTKAFCRQDFSELVLLFPPNFGS